MFLTETGALIRGIFTPLLKVLYSKFEICQGKNVKMSKKKARRRARAKAKREEQAHMLSLFNKKKEKSSTLLQVYIADTGRYTQTDYFKWIQTSERFRLASKPADADILLFTGGPDIDPKLYGQPQHYSTSTSPTRDRLDSALFYMGYDKYKVGICRGAQFLNVMSGGSMIQHIMGGAHKKPHDLRLKGGSTISNVPSTHHQMMVPSKKMSDRKILATATAHSFQTLVSPAEKCVPVQMGGDSRPFLNAYRTSDFNPLTQDAEIIVYNNTNSLCIQSHPEKRECPTQFRRYCEFLMESHARAFIAKRDRETAA